MVASDTKEQRTELRRGEERSESITGKKEGKVETNLTSERDLQADEREQRNAPVRDDREQKSYGKENCSCGETKTTTRRVSLLRSGISLCVFVLYRESFFFGFSRAELKSDQICCDNRQLGG